MEINGDRSDVGIYEDVSEIEAIRSEIMVDFDYYFVGTINVDVVALVNNKLYAFFVEGNIIALSEDGKANIEDGISFEMSLETTLDHISSIRGIIEG